MDSFNVNTINVEKADAILRNRQFPKITNLFRIIEICLVLILISRFSPRLSGELFRDLSVILISPRFVFVIGNAIVITLFAKSGQFSTKGAKGKNSGTDLYDEFVEKSEKIQKIGRDEIEYRTKLSIFEDTTGMAGTHNSSDLKTCRRSQSENLKHVKSKHSRHVLERSVTEKCVKSISSDEKPAKHSYPEDGMSNEEFRHTVEAFIARQQRLRREEEYAAFLLK